MDTTDMQLHETGSGGDLAILNNDLLMGESLYQQIYLALFGGNVEQSTKASYLESEDRFDYWGNTLIWNDVKTKQFNSETERTIRNTALNSAGRLSILQAVNSDLNYLKGVINFSVQVQVLGVSRIQITVTFAEKSNQQDKVLKMVYDNSKNEIIIDILI